MSIFFHLQYITLLEYAQHLRQLSGKTINDKINP